MPIAEPHAVAASRWRRSDLGVALVGLAAIAAWDASGLDIVVARMFGDASGFAWRHHWLVGGWLHDGARAVGWMAFALMVASLRWPIGSLRHLSRPRIAWLLATVAACAAVIPLLKHLSLTSCPWSLAEFGGTVAHYVPYWWPRVADGGPGGCFPSGHASTAFAFLGVSFALRSEAPAAARRWLLLVVAAGALLAAAQVVRGAHYVSHTLWTAWLCWAGTAASFHARLPSALRPWRLRLQWRGVNASHSASTPNAAPRNQRWIRSHAGRRANHMDSSPATVTSAPSTSVDTLT